ncbi:DUF2147 domain-containing protein [Taibaiella lutea]|uniref:DUF2147 domain-containing protein n=1 Tax=Taibaiella lutea TaxID=2608001 RepID=UPI00167FE035|nr:DUF2147 domain-containing protein [Taibaiella lutea]
MTKKISAFILSSLLLLLGTTFAANAQKEKVEGNWLNQEKDAKIEIYKARDGKFYGKIVWLKEPNRDGKPKTDINNPKENMKATPIMGLLILKGFNKDDDTSYEDGTIYDPKNGKTYSCKITVKDANTLSIRGYIGISLIGRTTTWVRSN